MPHTHTHTHTHLAFSLSTITHQLLSNMLPGISFNLDPSRSIGGHIPPLGSAVTALADQLSVQSLSHVRLLATPWTAAYQASLSVTNSQSLLKLISIESMMPSNHLILCRPLHLLPSISPSIRDFSNESTPRMRWPKYWSFSFSIIPSKEKPGLISFRTNWLDLLAVQGTLKSLH